MNEIMKYLDIPNIYKLNLYQILNMFWVKTNSIPENKLNSKLENTVTLQDTENTISKNQIFF